MVPAKNKDSDSVIPSTPPYSQIFTSYLFCQVAGLFWRILYLIVEHREVESQSEADGMSWTQVTPG